MKLLGPKSLPALANITGVTIPEYDRHNTGIGIVHLGPGAFHRAHQAVYTENAMNISGGNWGICGVSMRSPDARDKLLEQDYLYTLAILDSQTSYQIIGALKEILVAGQDDQVILTRMSAPETKIVSLTVTEKGYCLDVAGALNLSHLDIAYDLANPQHPRSAIGLLCEGLRLRYANDTQPFNVLSCDNVSENGDKLRKAVLQYAQHIDTDLATWIDENVSFPNSMVDSITPKTEPADIASVSEALGVADRWPIQRETFSQWVIDENWQGERPDWEVAGVLFTDNVAGFEKAKLRLLNGLHSTLAYSGSLAGFSTTYEASSNPHFHQFIEQLALKEIAGSFTPPSELNIPDYIKGLLDRLGNPAIKHQLEQIAWDGSQKIPERILPTVRHNLDRGRPITGLCLSLACWFEYLSDSLLCDRDIIDPLAAKFEREPDIRSLDSANVVRGFLNISDIFDPELASNPAFEANLIDSLTRVRKWRNKELPLSQLFPYSVF